MDSYHMALLPAVSLGCSSENVMSLNFFFLFINLYMLVTSTLENEEQYKEKNFTQFYHSESLYSPCYVFLPFIFLYTNFITC